jgi:hypothetical protein
LTGTLFRSDLDGRDIGLEVKYVARWAQSFLGLGDMLTDIPIGGMQHAFASGSFQLSLPNLLEDPLASTRITPENFESWERIGLAGRSSRNSFRRLNS